MPGNIERTEDYRPKVAERIKVINQWIADHEKKNGGGNDSGPPIEFIRKWYLSNEVGDSMIFNSLHRGKYVYNANEKRWMRYVGPHWELDHKGRAKNDVKHVVVEYAKIMAEINSAIERCDETDKAELKKLFGKKKGVIQRIDRLNSKAGRLNVLECANSNDDPLVVMSEEMDLHPWLLPCKNCVVDLRTGEALESKPEYYFSSVAPTEWKGLDEPAPVWDEFLKTSLDNNTPTIEFLLRCLGYSITGLN